MKLNFARIGCVVVFLSVVLGHGSTFAQQTLGWIDGEVTDSSGGVVQGVSIKARNRATNLEVTAESRGDGSFSIADLPIGTYELTFPSKDSSRRRIRKSLYRAIALPRSQFVSSRAKSPHKLQSTRPPCSIKLTRPPATFWGLN